MATFTLNIPEKFEDPGMFSIETNPFREGILALHELFGRQQEWIEGREVVEHVRSLLHREPTILEISHDWILWPGGLNLFWNQQASEYLEYHETQISMIHRQIYQGLWALQDPCHRYFVQQMCGGRMPSNMNVFMLHFRAFCARDMRLRLDPEYYFHWRERSEARKMRNLLALFSSKHIRSWANVSEAIPV